MRSTYIRLGRVTYTTVAVSWRPPSRWAVDAEPGTLVARAKVGRFALAPSRKGRWEGRWPGRGGCGGVRGEGGGAGRGVPGIALRWTSLCSRSDKFQQFLFDDVPQSSSSTEWWAFLLCDSFVFP